MKRASDSSSVQVVFASLHLTSSNGELTTMIYRLLPILLFVPAFAGMAAGITSISPNSADPGDTVSVTMTLDVSGTPPPPPSHVQPVSMSIGSMVGTSLSRSGYDCTATFTIPVDHEAGTLNCSVAFNPPPDQQELGQIVLSLDDGFTVNTSATSAPVISEDPMSQHVVLGGSVEFSITAAGPGVLSYQWQFDEEDIVSANSATYTIASVAALDEGDYQCIVSNTNGSVTSEVAHLIVLDLSEPLDRPYSIVDTGQHKFYGDTSLIAMPAVGDDFYGQDSNYIGKQPAYITSADGKTVYDYHTGLTWTQTTDLNGDGTIDVNDKLTQSEAVAYVATLNNANFGGYDDWRLPTIKEIYSLIDFRGTDPTSDNTATLVPFIDTDYFGFGYGDTTADPAERVIDAQMATSSIYVDTVMGGQTAMFGLNLADGRIKGYGLNNIDFYVFYVRGNTDYGINDFEDNGDDTVTDHATGLMWQQTDSGSGMLWQAALAYAEGSTHAGYDDWRLPNAKELQSLLDYTRSPGTTSSPAIDSVFTSTQITNEAGQTDYPWYYTSTTHANQDGEGKAAVYMCFGRATGYMNDAWLDVHGAGSQRSELKVDDQTGYTQEGSGWYFTLSPQGDSARWYNYVRLVRDAPEVVDTTPEVTLTTMTQTVSFDTDSLVIEGSHNEHATSISWSNALTEGSGMIYLSDTTFTIANIDLGMGDNTITITVSNAAGDETTTEIVVTRSSTFDGSVIYVDASTPASANNQNGRSWDTAFKHLQDALALVDEQEIRVAGGTYYPDEAEAGYATVVNDDRNSTFFIPANTMLYGGYNGYGAASPDSRSSTSLLSGDLDQDDVTGEGAVIENPSVNTKNNNSYSVVSAGESAADEPSLLDGFYITAGRADQVAIDATGCGGGIYAYLARGFSLNDCGFLGNYARYYGGALYWQSSGDQTISNCEFLGNEGYESGGAVYVQHSTPDFEDCHFEDNFSNRGGSIYVNDADLIVQRSTFQESVSEDGGAVYVSEAGTMNAFSCLFSGNNAISGGVFYVAGSLYLEHGTLAGSYADDTGAGIYAKSGSSVTVVNSIIANNFDSTGTDTSSASCKNDGALVVTISDSLIRGSGGSLSWDTAIGTNGGSNIDEDPQFVDPVGYVSNGTTAGDYRILATSPANDAGNNLYVTGSFDVEGDARIYNSIVDMGALEQSHGAGLPELAISNGETRAVADGGRIDIEGTANSYISGTIAWENLDTGNSGSFATSSNWTLADVPFKAGENSVVISAENAIGTSVTATVLIVNVGEVWFVDVDTPADLVDQDGKTWETAFADPQDGFDAMKFADDVWIAEGTYTPATGTSYEVFIEECYIYGGFESGMTARGSRNHSAYPVVFDGGGEQRLILSLTFEDMVLDGIEFTNAVGTTDLTTVGVWVADLLDDLEVKNCTFRGLTIENSADAQGLAMKVVGPGSGGDVVISNCTFENNSTSIDCGADGIGLYAKDLKSLTLTDSVFENNIKGARYGEIYGGAIYLGTVDTVSITGCDFINNGGDPYQGRARGGAIAFEGTTNAFIEDCRFEGNYLEESLSGTSTGGAAVSVYHGNATVSVDRCEFVENTFTDQADAYGGALHAYSGQVTVMNSLFRGNSATRGGAIYLRSGNHLVSNCTVVKNDAATSGGGVCLDGSGSVLNSIVYDNTATSSANINIIETGDVDYTCSNSARSGTGNIAADPLFVDAANHDYRLEDNSPCVNVGANALWMEGADDLDGEARMYAQRVDIGAYEASGAGIADADTDDDGIGDFDELVVYGTDAEKADSDSDGMNDGDELVAGTDSTDPSSILAVSVSINAEGNFDLAWPSVDGRSYTLRGSTDLALPAESWDDLGTYSATEPSNLAEVTSAVNAYFFRLEVSDEPQM